MMGTSAIICFMILACYIGGLQSLPPKLVRLESKNNLTNETNQTISDLVQQQTDYIKQIVTNQQNLQYGPTTEREINNKTKIKTEIDQNWLEDLRMKCQHLENLLKANNTEKEAPAPYYKPQVRVDIKKPIQGFYITTEKSFTTRKPPQSTTSNVKMVKLEPVILQKTILNDGRTIYYWHKSLPGALHYPSLPSQTMQSITPPPPPPTTTTTTATTISSGYNFRNFFPSVYSFKNPEENLTPTTTTTTTTTTEPSPISSPDDMLYQQQLRFVLPVPYIGEDEENERSPQYNKPYPKVNSLSVRIPYLRDFHIIKALTIPNSS